MQRVQESLIKIKLKPVNTYFIPWGYISDLEYKCMEIHETQFQPSFLQITQKKKKKTKDYIILIISQIDLFWHSWMCNDLYSASL